MHIIQSYHYDTKDNAHKNSICNCKEARDNDDSVGWLRNNDEIWTQEFS